jgi:cytochrome c-type biogenesis protein CcmE
MKKKNPAKLIATVVIVISALAYLVSGSFGETMVYYKTVQEVLAAPAEFERSTIRVNGSLVAGSIARKAGTDKYRFVLSRANKALTVAYTGILPDSMVEGRELVVQGSLNPVEMVFEAEEILTKCPSKHEARGREQDDK